MTKRQFRALLLARHTEVLQAPDGSRYRVVPEDMTGQATGARIRLDPITSFNGQYAHVIPEPSSASQA